MQQNSRMGFTLVELVVVIIIIGILIGLFLPALGHTSGESRRRIQCHNSLKNLSVATINFEGAKKSYPGYQNYFGQSKSATTNAKVGTWAVSLMPYLEQQPLADIWDDPATNAQWAKAAPSTLFPDSEETDVERFYPQIRIFECPSDTFNEEQYARNSYVANCGFWILSAPKAVRVSSAFGYTNTVDDILHSQKAANGVFVDKAPSVNGFAAHKNSVSSKDITDGLSMTLMYSENMQADSWRFVSPETPTGSTRSRVGMVWHYRLQQPTSSATRPVADNVLNINKINGDKLIAMVGDPEAARPSSNHPGVVTACMMDGSTKNISENIDYQVYQSLMTPQTSQSDVPNNQHQLTANTAFE